jgi:short-subunit dehydrogenase
VLLTRAVLPGMVQRKRGKIVNNSSVSGKMFLPAANTYAASKAGVVGFSESLRQELKGTGVTVLLLITPGIKTDMFQQIEEKYGPNLDLSFVQSIPAGQWVDHMKLAFVNDDARLYPKGFSRVGVFVGHHFPEVLEKLVSAKFKRTNLPSA